MTVEVRPVEAGDVPAVVTMVHALAAYEREPESCRLTVEQLTAALFGETPALFGHVGVVDGAVAGFALWFLNFSTWKGRHGLYLEDLFVAPEYRRAGVGRALLGELAATCVRRDLARFEWSVLDWNSPAQDFYRTLGAVPMDEWTGWRLDGSALAAPEGAATRQRRPRVRSRQQVEHHDRQHQDRDAEGGPTGRLAAFQTDRDEQTICSTTRGLRAAG